jgi:chemotaxis family two-component system response regulator Rcp1
MKDLPKILLVEDNEGDAVLVFEALQNAEVKAQLVVVDDGEEAIQYLSRDGKYKGESLPDLILLDLNLPKVDGKGVLVFVKTNHELRRIPVVMLTTSSLQTDIDFAYDNHVNCYIVKSGNLTEFYKIIHSLEHFWVNTVTYANKN